MLNFFKFMKARGFEYPPGEERQSNRALEWYLSLLEIVFCLLLLVPGWQVLSDSPHEHLLGLMPEYGWGLAFGFKGLMHATALYINGDGWRWTPWVRAVSCSVSSLFWAFILVWAFLQPANLHPDFLYALAALNTFTYLLLARSCAHDAGQYWERYSGRGD